MLPELSKHNQAFVEATIAQLNKDLEGLYVNLLHVDFDSPVNLPDQVSDQLTPILIELSKRSPEQLSQFIYRVDLSEKKFFQSVSAQPSLNNLSILVLEREAQKVYLRLKFS